MSSWIQDQRDLETSQRLLQKEVAELRAVIRQLAPSQGSRKPPSSHQIEQAQFQQVLSSLGDRISNPFIFTGVCAFPDLWRSSILSLMQLFSSRARSGSKGGGQHTPKPFKRTCLCRDCAFNRDHKCAAYAVFQDGKGYRIAGVAKKR